MNSAASIEIVELAARLLKAAGLPAAGFRTAALPGGRNNLVFRVAPRKTAPCLLKLYFHDPGDPRDRLGQESAFLRHLESTGCRLAPRLLAEDRQARAALLEFIGGEPIRLDEVTEADVDRAFEFFRQANAGADSLSGRSMPAASEACFSIAEHLQTTQRRVERLERIDATGVLGREASLLAKGELAPLWSEVRSGIEAEWPDPAARAELIPHVERCLSPSDFGFHNALREPGGAIRFLDFEYAGWDDPAKLVCDFGNQPDRLLPSAHSRRFRDAALRASSSPAKLARRIDALEPLYRVKWTCICLNDFLDAGGPRRRFTEGVSADPLARHQLQLSRARRMLARVRDEATQPAQT